MEEKEQTNEMPEETAPVEETVSPAPDSESADENAAPLPDYEALAGADMRTLRAEFPEILDISDLSMLDDPARYGELREMGLSPKEAYLATRKPHASGRDNRSHLKSALPRAVVGGGEGIAPEDLSDYREIFDGMTDHEIRKLYKKVTR